MTAQEAFTKWLSEQRPATYPKERDAFMAGTRWAEQTAAKEIARQVAEAIRDARQQEREQVWAIVDKFWSFDNHQQHTHSWHCKQDCYAAIEEGQNAHQ